VLEITYTTSRSKAANSVGLKAFLNQLKKTFKYGKVSLPLAGLSADDQTMQDTSSASASRLITRFIVLCNCFQLQEQSKQNDMLRVGK